jgi:hypothetical protein
VKVPLVGAELLHVDGPTGMTKPIVAFRNYANAHKKLLHFFITYLLDNKIYKDKRAGYIANTS